MHVQPCLGHRHRQHACSMGRCRDRHRLRSVVALLPIRYVSLYPLQAVTPFRQVRFVGAGFTSDLERSCNHTGKQMSTTAILCGQRREAGRR